MNQSKDFFFYESGNLQIKRNLLIIAIYCFRSMKPIMFRRKTKVYSDIKYDKLNHSEDQIFDKSDHQKFDYNNEDYLDSQFSQPYKEKVPWKAISLAFLLCSGGLILLTVAVLIIAGLLDAKFNDRMWPIIITGMIMFVPGVYHIRIAIYAYKQYPGYSFDDIPGFD